MSEQKEKQSSDVTVNVNRASAVVAALVGLAGLLSPWFVFQYRVEAAEKRIETMEREMTTMRDILIRVDENVKGLTAAQRRSDRQER